MTKPYEKFFERVMSYNDALTLLKSKDKEFNVNDITKFRKKFAKMYHPDIYKGDPDTLKDINNALDIIEKGGGSNQPSEPRSYTRPQRTNVDPSPFGANPDAGFSDLNNIKAYAKEKYGKHGEAYGFAAFDGAYGRLSFTTYCTNDLPAIEDMSNILIFWNGSMHGTKAVIVDNFELKTKQEVMVFKVVGDKIDVNSKEIFQHDSFNNNPFNDQHFEKRLRSWVRE